MDPCLTPCQYNRTFLTHPEGYGSPDITYSGIRVRPCVGQLVGDADFAGSWHAPNVCHRPLQADASFGFGLYDTTPYGDAAYNYIMKYWYTYIPGTLLAH